MRASFSHVPANWRATAALARSHSVLWPSVMVMMWLSVFCLTTVFLQEGNPQRVLGLVSTGVFSLITTWMNYVGIKAMWLCKKNNIKLYDNE